MKNDSKKKRQEHNKDIVKRMRKGENLATIDMMESWFPPRPIIKKDEKLMKKLHGTNDDEEEPTKSKNPSKLSVCRPSKSR